MRSRLCETPKEAHCTEVSPGGELLCEEHQSTRHDVHWARRRDGSRVTWYSRASSSSRKRGVPAVVEEVQDYCEMRDAQVLQVTKRAVKVESPDLDGETWVLRAQIIAGKSGRIVVGESTTLAVPRWYARQIGLLL